RRSVPALEFRLSDDAVLQQLVDQPREPTLVVAHPQVLVWRHELELMTGVVEVLSSAARSNHSSERIYAAFPRFVEYRLILFVLNGPHAMHAAHIMNTVHLLPPGFGGATFPTPTIESRVTSSASASSVIFSVPAGRSGRTI